VKAFLDTSVLVATFYADHVHHSPSIELFLRYGKAQSGCSAHSLAEVYATLTAMPGSRRVSGHEALLFLGDIRQHLTIVSLDEHEYFRLAETCSVAGLSGRAIYDAIVGQCALKANAEVLYTWNTRDFLPLPAKIAGLVRTPEK
jgi:predicted nucleic acid-binding protein